MKAHNILNNYNKKRILKNGDIQLENGQSNKKLKDMDKIDKFISDDVVVEKYEVKD